MMPRLSLILVVLAVATATILDGDKDGQFMKGQPTTSAEWLQHVQQVAGPEGHKLFNPLNPYDRLPPKGANPDFECAWRNAAYKYAQKLQPNQPHMKAVFDALALESCNQTYTFKPKTKLVKKYYETNSTFYVSPSGNDNNDGSFSNPFKTLVRAIGATRGLGQDVAGTIVLRGGTHRLTETLVLTAADNGLTIENYQNEQAILSGAIDLGTLQWEKYNVTNGTNTWDQQQNQNAVYGAPSTTDPTQPAYIYNKTKTVDECVQACQSDPKCTAYTWHDGNQGDFAYDCYFRTDGVYNLFAQSGHISGHRIGSSMNVWVADVAVKPAAITGLRVSGNRAIRARYPNANPELDQFPKGWISGKTKWFGPLHGTEPDTNIEVDNPNRAFEQDEFQNYELGVGGTCESFTPPEGYWCSSKTSGGGAFTYRIPAGLVYDTSLLPHSASYKNATGAVIQAWRPGHWASWMFEVDKWNPQNSSFGWSFGGFQGARGSDSGDEWFIENVFEELDSENEYFYDETTNKLYFYYNASVGTPPPSSGLEATNLKEYIRIVSDQSNPAVNITIRGLTIRDAAYTYLDPHGMPSGGDWGLQRTGVIFIEGTEFTNIEDNFFIRNDGIGIMVSGYNRNVTLQENEFVWHGETAMAAWGYTNNMDGTSGSQPRHTNVLNNFVHEIGHYEKQSSPWFQAKTAQSLIKGNIFFNGPRALINLNDGFGGGTMIEENLLFNSCRESSDHGPINSWDRQPFLTEVRNGTPSLIPAYSHIQNNFAVANYGADGGCFDTDDGSSWYIVQNNFFVYGGHKSDFNGHNKRSYNNINVYPQVYGPRCLTVPLPDPKLGHDFDEGYVNCTCILATSGETYLNLQNCKNPTADSLTIILGNNTLYAPDSSVTVDCGGSMSFKDWEALGLDNGTTVQGPASTSDIISWAQQLLGF